MFVVGLVLIYLTRKKLLETSSLMLKKPGSQIGRGLAWFFLTPLVCILLLVTIIGIPLSFLTIAIYAVMLYISKVFAAIALGVWLAKSFGWKKASLIWKMILGVLALVILQSIPFIGWLVCLVAIWWGLGAIIEMKKKVLKEMNE